MSSRGARKERPGRRFGGGSTSPACFVFFAAPIVFRDMNWYNAGMSRLWIFIIVIVVAAGALYFSGSNPNDSGNVAGENDGGAETAAVSESEAVSESVAIGEEAGAVREITVFASNFRFSESEIRVKKGETVRLTLVNNEGFHDFVIDELGVATERIREGASTTIEFTADTVGEFPFYCSVGNHRALGMEGKFIVEE